ncbi:SH3 domain-containing protein [Riemerella anatipestifer]|uniref:SH3 domain-containing protein n=1 Tax=Riemerella anatipestifer TaxID=34085 RepID=A0AAP6HH49_RIEAN|nr:SH3 domain-containing protein [Riemerella anatipestifer]MCD5969177.1 SH3 domain-containing protein [Riemerella anatipestifer]MCO7354488.1 SH3 domain-containing protein [Riemerella anatipestifer]MCU7540929.1 SH3 domain-containing protein [Riemerella anatipestifer]MCU7570913.1 SH3 domain-containing protein [Riemerella anatipestifer]MCU7598247.1 SH3 domain-containing protein [Riemerella anatipestifer]
MKSFSRLFLLVFFSISSFLLAQEEQWIFMFEENSSQKVLIDKTNVRAEPNLQSPKVDSLDIGQVVKIVQKTEQVLSLGKRSASWYRINYIKEGETKSGYIWGANLSLGYRSRDGYDFLFGASATEQDEVKLDVVMLKDKQNIQKVSFNVGTESLTSVAFKWQGNKGLDGVSDVLLASVSGEACGIPNYEQYILLNGSKMVALPMLISVADADVFYHSEEYVFPKDKRGVKGKIIMKTEEMEKDEKDKEHIRKSKKVYLFKDGNVSQL